MEKTKEDLIAELNHDDESQRLYAVEDIYDSKQNELAVDLVKRLKIESSKAVKNSIVQVLQKMEYEKVYGEIFELFPDEDPFLRNSAVTIFASYGEDAVVFLSSYIDHSNKEVRKLILDSLVEMANGSNHTRSSSLEILRACLHDPEINVVITAVEYLGKLNDQNSVHDIVELFLKKDEPMLRSSILDSLQKIGDKEEIGKVIGSLMNDEILSNSLYTPQIIRLLAISGKTDELLKVIEEMPDIAQYTSDIIFSLDHLVRNDSLAPEIVVSTIEKFSNLNLSEETKFISVKLLHMAGTSNSLGIIKEWANTGSEEFKQFCNEVLAESK
ncbi:MAG: HEAT repeat domain-containing protein [Leptospiraceae bacterium]|nr:HEAT repeat domain-containing protein [Leptospiraceae bacterium]MCP5510434.1 HEAT repeat domain-containing protein [Leptospiraceae bacterium]